MTGFSIRKFLDRVAGTPPAPGGGSAAALSAALGAALAEKTSRIVLSRSKVSAKAKGQARGSLSRLSRIRGRLELLIEEDAEGYRRLVQAARTGRGLTQARQRATEVPREIARLSRRAWREAGCLRPFSGAHLGADLKAARAFLTAGSSAASEMVKVNLRAKGASRR